MRGEVLDVLRQLRARAEQEGDDVRGLRPRNRHRCVSEGSGGRVYNGDEHVLEDVVWSQPLIWSIRPISEQQFELCEGAEQVVCPAAERGRGDEGEAGHGCWQRHSRVKEHVIRAEKPVCCVHLGRGMAEKSACVLDAVRLPPVQVPRSVRSTEEGRHARWGQGPPDVTIRELWVERGETRREQYVGYLPMRDDAVAARDRCWSAQARHDHRQPVCGVDPQQALACERSAARRVRQTRVHELYRVAREHHRSHVLELLENAVRCPLGCSDSIESRRRRLLAAYGYRGANWHRFRLEY